MNDAMPMRHVERASDLDGVTKNLVWQERSFFETTSERLAFQVLHHQEVDADIGADIVENADVRVLERRDGLRLTQESLSEFGMVLEIF